MSKYISYICDRNLTNVITNVISICSYKANVMVICSNLTNVISIWLKIETVIDIRSNLVNICLSIKCERHLF